MPHTQSTTPSIVVEGKDIRATVFFRTYLGGLLTKAFVQRHYAYQSDEEASLQYGSAYEWWGLSKDGAERGLRSHLARKDRRFHKRRVRSSRPLIPPRDK